MNINPNLVNENLNWYFARLSPFELKGSIHQTVIHLNKHPPHKWTYDYGYDVWKCLFQFSKTYSIMRYTNKIINLLQGNLQFGAYRISVDTHTTYSVHPFSINIFVNYFNLVPFSVLVFTIWPLSGMCVCSVCRRGCLNVCA